MSAHEQEEHEHGHTVAIAAPRDGRLAADHFGGHERRGRSEIVTVSMWESRSAIEGFAGQDIDQAVFYPEDDRYLIERDLTVSHYEVAGSE
jgi:heme-degrading monooxygenase HmoA